VVGLGTRNFIVREMVVRRDRAPALVGTAIVLRVLLVPLFLAAVFVFGRFAHYGHAGTIVLYLAAAATSLGLLAEPMQAGFQAVERMEYIAASDVLNKSAQSLLGVGLALAGFRAIGITASWIAAAGAVVLLDLYWLRRHVGVVVRSAWRGIWPLLRDSVPYWSF